MAEKIAFEATMGSILFRVNTKRRSILRRLFIYLLCHRSIANYHAESLQTLSYDSLQEKDLNLNASFLVRFM